MVNALTASMMIDSRFISFSSLHVLAEVHVSDRCHKKRNRNRQINQILHEQPPDKTFCSYHEPSLRPHHQMRPTVAVFCCLLRIPCTSVKNDGWFEKLRCHSYRVRNPLPRL